MESINNFFDEYEIREESIRKAILDKPAMWYALHLVGVWCKGKKARCYMGNEDACSKCKFKNNKGCN